ncbi:MAG: RHS repeat-associated core domain-containing protein [Candidatus Obscuribacterales bacterium]
MPTSQGFSGNAVLDTNPDSISVSATAGGGTGTTTNGYKLGYVGANATLTFDANGNMTSDGTNSYSWDAENRLIQITFAGSGNNTQFAYDPLSQNTKIEERIGGTVTNTEQFVCCNAARCEQRDAAGVLIKRFYAYGQIKSASSNLYCRDHLGSIHDLVDSAGNVLVQYSFDPFGRAARQQGTADADFQYGGYYVHGRSGLALALYRAYSPTLGRWLNRDPIGEAGGVNLFAYVGNEPLSAVDPLGLNPLSSLSDSLKAICRDPDCVAPDNQADCLKAADKIQDAINKFFEKFNSKHGTAPKGDPVNGYWCYEWAWGLNNAIRNAHQQSFQTEYNWQRQQIEGNRYKVHVGLTPCASRRCHL